MASGVGASLVVSNLTASCKVSVVRVEFRATSTNLATSSIIGVELAKVGGPTVSLFSSALTGMELGSTCPSDLAFQSGAASTFPPASPPYTGTFRPAQALTAFAGTLANGTWELRWTFDGNAAGSIVATQGDIVYAPPKTWHAPEFWGKQGLNCRLTSSTYPSANHLYDARQ